MLPNMTSPGPSASTPASLSNRLATGFGIKQKTNIHLRNRCDCMKPKEKNPIYCDHNRKRLKQRLFVSFPTSATAALTLFVLVAPNGLFSIAAPPIITYPPKDQTVILY